MKKFSYIILFLFLFSFKNSISQDIEELLQPKCDGKTIKYSYSVNLLEYLQNENTEGKEIYYTAEDLKSKRVGRVKDTYMGNKTLDIMKVYEDGENFQEDLIRHKIDAVILIDGLCRTVKMVSNEISIYPEPFLEVENAFGLQKDNLELKNQLDTFIDENAGLHERLLSIWDLAKNEAGFLNTNLDGDKGILNVLGRIGYSPYSYLRDGDKMPIGSEVDFIYRFARKYGYKINIKLVGTYEEIYESLKNKSCDIALGFFVVTEDKDISFSKTLYKGKINYLVRYGNLPDSLVWTTLYDKIEDFNGEKIGIQIGAFYDELTENTFPKSTFFYKEQVSDLFGLLLLEEINAFIFDLPVVEYYEINFGWRVTHYKLNMEPYNNAFGFQKNEEGEALLKEFNDFLKTIDLKAIYDKWNTSYWSVSREYAYEVQDSHLNVDTDLDPNGKLLNVAFYMDLKPICFYKSNVPAGIEMDILYRFAKARNYYINLTSVNFTERITYIQEGKANITGGSFSINEERKKFVHFSDPLYECQTVLAVRLDSKKEKITLFAQDPKFYEKKENSIDIQVKFGDQIKDSSCLIPNNFNDTILLNCTISDISNVNVSNGFEYFKSEDKILILYDYIEVDNLLQANTKIKDHPNIIQIGNTTNIICQSSPSILKSVAIISVSILILPVMYFITQCLI